jgi:hypothetical protein
VRPHAGRRPHDHRRDRVGHGDSGALTRESARRASSVPAG